MNATGEASVEALATPALPPLVEREWGGIDTEQLVVGHVVVQVHSGFYTLPTISKPLTVIKVTKTQFTLDNGQRYLRRNGAQVGDDYRYRGAFHVPDSKAVRDVRRTIEQSRATRALTDACQRLSPNTAPVQLPQIRAALEAAEKVFAEEEAS